MFRTGAELRKLVILNNFRKQMEMDQQEESFFNACQDDAKIINIIHLIQEYVRNDPEFELTSSDGIMVYLLTLYVYTNQCSAVQS